MTGLPDEPILATQAIQGLALPGFRKRSQTLIYVRHARSESAVADIQAFLRTLRPRLANAAATLQDRRAGGPRRPGDPGMPARRAPLVGIAFTWPGLVCLAPSARRMAGAAFRLGMGARSGLLGDPVDADDPHHHGRWSVGGDDTQPDFMIVVAGDERAAVDPLANELRARLAPIAARVWHDDGDRLGTGERGHEHFGFVDGISQPGIRGVAGPLPADFLTRQRLATSGGPEAARVGYPGEDLVWPGEFVLGYPRTGPDPLRPGPLATATPDWTRDGAFLVLRRLNQDVGGFWAAMRAEAERLSRRPGFEDLTPVGLAARLMGRWPSGAALARTGPVAPPADARGLGDNEFADNDFLYDAPTPPRRFACDAGQAALQAEAQALARRHPAPADPAGLRCPLAAHIRKVNPRDAATDMGAPTAHGERRMLRVGLPFGPPHPACAAASDTHAPPAHAADDGVDRGLLFLSIQASIEEQFEFVQARWMNDPLRPRGPGGRDLVAGSAPDAPDGRRACTLVGRGLATAEVSAAAFVHPTGGAYFFVPSLRAIDEVLAR